MLPTSTAAILDRAELAWAAGFFDGEGSTIVHIDESRPGYLRLEVRVPQSGHGAGVPAALVRFQTAVGHMGRIVGPDKTDIYKWVSRGRLESIAVVAFLWSHIGPVKRQQANEAIKAFLTQYEVPGIAPRAADHEREIFDLLGLFREGRGDSRQLDLAWAAGFMDAEGSFGTARANKRVRGPNWYRVRASATQHGAPGVVPEVLLRLQRVLGGFGRIECHGDIDDFKWVAEGDANVERVLRTLEPSLGAVKVSQARNALERFRAQPRLKGNATHCVRGHEYSYAVVRGGRLRRICKPCARILERRWRAKQGISPRRFKDPARRYT
ncbi:MAG: hypothetical protein M3O80_06945 [Chloroflexota bacterium]|nr:hypothetical protein [Chloroflexota bacterium]